MKDRPRRLRTNALIRGMVRELQERYGLMKRGGSDKPDLETAGGSDPEQVGFAW